RRLRRYRCRLLYVELARRRGRRRTLRVPANGIAILRANSRRNFARLRTRRPRLQCSPHRRNAACDARGTRADTAPLLLSVEAASAARCVTSNRTGSKFRRRGGFQRKLTVPELSAPHVIVRYSPGIFPERLVLPLRQRLVFGPRSATRNRSCL